LETDPSLNDLAANAVCSITHTGPYIVAAIAIIVLLIAASLIAGCEVAFFSMSQTDLKKLRKDSGRLSKTILNILDDPDRFIATIITLKNLINVAVLIIGTLIAISATRVIEPDWIVFVVEFLVFFLLVLLFEAKIPHAYMSTKSLAFAQLMAYPIMVFEFILRPVNYLLIYSKISVSERLIQIKYKLTIDELSHILDTTTASTRDISILKGLVRFADADVKEIMRSRIDVVAVDLSGNFEELSKIVIESGYSRLPVYDESIDNIKGILFVKDLLPFINNRDNSFNWHDFVRPAYFSPESRRIHDLLKDMQRNKIHMAVITDEYGGTSGIVTLEDIIEEIVGEIRDESDVDEIPYTRINDNSYIFEGKLLLNDLFKIVNINDNAFDAIPGDSETLAGLILDLKGEMPVKGERIEYKNFEFVIESADKHRINSVRFTIQPDVPDEKND